MNTKKIKIWVDEAGRWPWLGPVVACSLCFNDIKNIDKKLLSELNDSKKLTEKKRDELFKHLIDLSLWDNPKISFWVWVVDNFVIDEINIRQANREAMRRSLVEILRKINIIHPWIPSFNTKGRGNRLEVVIDWRDNYEFEELEKKPIYIVWWDAKVLEISAASIIAKVFRDKLINTYSSIYPDFYLEKHKWYGTKKHRDYLTDKSKVTGIHRMSYKPVKKVLEHKPKLLLHVCCWPDVTVPILDLKRDYDLLCFWYDPNIQPKREYNKRLKAFKKVCEIEKVGFEVWEYDDKEFFKKIKWLEKEPEKGKRCTVCYDMRLKKTAELAQELGIEYWTTTLSISPHKDLKKIFEIGEKYSKIIHPWIPSLVVERRGGQIVPEFLKIDFKKNDGFQRSIEYCKEKEFIGRIIVVVFLVGDRALKICIIKKYIL